MQAVQLLTTRLAAAAASNSSQNQGQLGLPKQHGVEQAGKLGSVSDAKQQQQLLRGKGAGQKGGGSSKGAQQQKRGKQGRQAAPPDKLFTRNTQQQQQAGQHSTSQAVVQGSGPSSDAEQQGLVDDLLCLLEGVLLHLMPAAVRGWDALGLAGAAAAAAGAGMGAWGPQAAELQEEQQAAVAMLQAVLRVLQAMMDAGGWARWEAVLGEASVCLQPPYCLGVSRSDRACQQAAACVMAVQQATRQAS